MMDSEVIMLILLTFKAPITTAAGDSHFNFLILSFEENKA